MGTRGHHRGISTCLTTSALGAVVGGCSLLGGSSLPTWLQPGTRQYMVMDRGNWLDFDPADAQTGVETAIAHDHRVVVFGKSSVQEVNRVLSDDSASKPRIIQLGSVEPYLPTKSVRVRRENATINDAVLLDADAVVAAGGFGSAGGSTYYLFQANLVMHSVKYDISIMDLFRSGLIGSRGPNGFSGLDLNGLPRNYYAFDALESSNSATAKASTNGALVLASASGTAEGKSTQRWTNKIFAVDFLREPGMSPGQRFRITTEPLSYTYVSLTQQDSIEREVSEYLDGYVRTNWLVEHFDPDIEISDPETKSTYRIGTRRYTNSPGATVMLSYPTQAHKAVLEQLMSKDGRKVCVRSAYESGSPFTIKFEGGTVWSRPAGGIAAAAQGVIIPRSAGMETDSPYEGRWVYYESGRAVHVVEVTPEWQKLRDFVEFVK